VDPVLVNSLGWLLGVIVFLIVLGIFFVPTIIAYNRRHKWFIPILVINLVAGVFVVGWVVAFVMAVWPGLSRIEGRY
jgi:hypothetical protein